METVLKCTEKTERHHSSVTRKSDTVTSCESTRNQRNKGNSGQGDNISLSLSEREGAGHLHVRHLAENSALPLPPKMKPLTNKRLKVTVHKGIYISISHVVIDIHLRTANLPIKATNSVT